MLNNLEMLEPGLLPDVFQVIVTKKDIFFLDIWCEKCILHPLIEALKQLFL